MTTEMPTPDAVVGFWRDAGPARWFMKDEAFDADFRVRFHDAHMLAAARRLDSWLDHAEGALALIILLDQFPRNCFRGTGHMFATDSLALSFAGRALDQGFDRELPADMRAFLYLPFEHSENLAHQHRAVELFTPLGGEGLAYAVEHHEIIARFGRFPHRNAVLGRETTADEQAFLDGGGFAG